jgi:ABC-type multidrug transport system ATPase subunit
VSLLELEHVSKHYRRGARERIALRAVSLRIDTGEHVAVWGQRRSGRSTLLRVAAGVELADEGIVRFQGRDLRELGAETVRGQISYCRRAFRPADGVYVLDQLITCQLTRGVPAALARSRARDALERTGATHCAPLRPHDLDGAETARAVVARGLVHQPRLLVLDEPTLGIDPHERDGILELLRSLADDGVAVLMSTGETPSLAGADRALALSDGRLGGEAEPAELAPLLPFRRSATG